MKKYKRVCKKLFCEVAIEWIDDKSPLLKESSVSKYRNIISLYLIPLLGNMYVTSITRGAIAAFCSDLLKTSGLSPKSINGMISVLRNILLYASKKYSFDLPDTRDIFVKQQLKPMRILSLEEQTRINKYLLDNISPCNLGILLCLFTGIRIGEVCALKWLDINTLESSVHIHKSMQRIQINKTDDTSKRTKIIVDSPKSVCSIRIIPIPQDMLYILKRHQQDDDVFLLTGKRDKYMEPRSLENKFKELLKKCEIENVNFHALRHTFATRCVELGFDIKCLSEILGHASVNITLNRYVHPSMKLKQANMDKLSRLLPQ